ncbi:MAG: hypothetical protein IT578_10465 [Verrucomicrobiae bacterium]|nr:hypothetical protein [Verrucomicrobiae bacterium]
MTPLRTIGAVAAILTGVLPAAGSESVDVRLLNPALPPIYGAPISLLREDETCQVEVRVTSGSVWSAAAATEREVTVRYAAEQVLEGRMDYGQMGSQKATPYNLKTAKAFSGEQPLVLKPGPGGVLLGTATFAPKPFRYGLFALEIRVLDKSGQELVRKNFEYEALMKLPLEKPGNIAGYDAYGAHYYGGDPNSDFPKPSPAERRVLSDHGFTWAHLLGCWEFVHTAPGRIQRLDLLDAWVDAARQQNARIIFMLADGAHAYTGKRLTGIPSLSNTAAHWDMSLYREWAETLFQRYKGKVEVWDAWNEPDSKEFAQAEDRDLQALRIVRTLKEKYAPQSKIILSPHTHDGLNYLKRLLEKGAAKELDGIGVHPYRGLAPEVPEPDAYTGNARGVATFLEEMDETHELLKAYHVNPPDVYITEKNYNLNFLMQYNELDQVNFMMRLQILARTRDYIKSCINHAPRNGRLLLPAYPNLIVHLMDAAFRKRIEVEDPEIYGFLFEKSDGRVSLPLWSIKGEKVVELSGLRDEPRVTDMYGNPLPIRFNRKEGRLDFLRLTTSPLYVLAPKGSQPKLALTRLLEVAAPRSVERGGRFKLAVRVRELANPPARLVVQTLAGWQISPSAETPIAAAGKYEFSVKIPENIEAGDYSVNVLLVASDERTLAIESADLSVVLPVSASRKKYGFLIASDFGKEGLGGWTLQKSQTTIEMAQDDGEDVVRLTQKGIDHPGVMEQMTADLPYGALSFEIRRMSRQQSFGVQLGALKLAFDKEQRLGYYNRKGEFEPVANSVVGTWQTVRVMFSAPDGWFRLWLDDKFCGQFPLPERSGGLANLRFMTGTTLTNEPAVFLLKNIRLTRIEPVTWEKEKPVLHWSFCGPFPNRLDPGTMKRPFETEVDGLRALGGEVSLAAAPGWEVKGPDGKLLVFTPFEAPNSKYQNIPMVDFFTVKDLGLFQNQSDILCYGIAYLVSPTEREATLRLSSDDGYALWVNHAPVGKFNVWPYGHSIGQSAQTYSVKLRQGLNVFLIKVDQGGGGYGFYCEVK